MQQATVELKKIICVKCKKQYAWGTGWVKSERYPLSVKAVRSDKKIKEGYCSKCAGR